LTIGQRTVATDLSDSETAAAVRVRALSHAYGPRRALVEVSFEVPRGQLFAILGPNASGKTTLFRVLSTFVPCQRGDVTLLGCDLRREIPAVRRRLGVVFQAASLDRMLTVLENIHFRRTDLSLSPVGNSGCQLA